MSRVIVFAAALLLAGPAWAQTSEPVNCPMGTTCPITFPGAVVPDAYGSYGGVPVSICPYPKVFCASVTDGKKCTDREITEIKKWDACVVNNSRWTLYTQTYGGRIGITHSLLKDECETRRKQAVGLPSSSEEEAAAAFFAKNACHSSICNGWSEHFAIVSSDIRFAACRERPLP